MAGSLCWGFILFCVHIQNATSTHKLYEQFSWTLLDYAYLNPLRKVQALQTQEFIPENNLPVGIEVWNDKLFVSVPRWRQGIPSTLNYIWLHPNQIRSPPLTPYPNWESNESGNCAFGLTTVYRIKADACNRLWVLDAGTVGIGNTTQNVCPYALNIFDLTTDRRIRRYELRPEDINPDTFIANIAVDLRDRCDDAFAYMSDELGYGLIVYSWKENRSWRFNHGYFMPDPLAGDFTIDGLNFQWSDEGIFGMSLSPVSPTGERVLFFSPLASYRQFAVSTSVLQNSSSVDNSYHEFVALPERGANAHVIAQTMDDNGVQLLGLIDKNAIGCWNSGTAHQPANIAIVDRDDTALIFPSDIKIDKNGHVWTISDKMSTFLLSNLDYTQTNFRIFVAPLRELIGNTVCDVRFKESLIYH